MVNDLEGAGAWILRFKNKNARHLPRHDTVEWHSRCLRIHLWHLLVKRLDENKQKPPALRDQLMDLDSVSRLRPDLCTWPTAMCVHTLTVLFLRHFRRESNSRWPQRFVLLIQHDDAFTTWMQEKYSVFHMHSLHVQSRPFARRRWEPWELHCSLLGESSQRSR